MCEHAAAPQQSLTRAFAQHESSNAPTMPICLIAAAFGETLGNAPQKNDTHESRRSWHPAKL
eukprot:366370-Chlamydomonas_euryale.AAC.12